MSQPTKPIYEFGPFRLETTSYRLLRQGEPVPLAPKEFDLLLVLVERRGQVMSKDDLLKTVLGLGTADTLITKLSNLQQLIVRPTSVVLKYTNPPQDPVAVGREQKVDAVLEGSIQRAGERVRVTVRLLRAESGAPIWASRYDEKRKIGGS